VSFLRRPLVTTRLRDSLPEVWDRPARFDRLEPSARDIVHHVSGAVNKAPGGLPEPRRTLFWVGHHCDRHLSECSSIAFFVLMPGWATQSQGLMIVAIGHTPTGVQARAGFPYSDYPTFISVSVVALGRRRPGTHGSGSPPHTRIPKRRPLPF
jgi:hypothetical protein